jgi:hypothetical protein
MTNKQTLRNIKFAEFVNGKIYKRLLSKLAKLSKPRSFKRKILLWFVNISNQVMLDNSQIGDTIIVRYYIQKMDFICTITNIEENSYCVVDSKGNSLTVQPYTSAIIKNYTANNRFLSSKRKININTILK